MKAVLESDKLLWYPISQKLLLSLRLSKGYDLIQIIYLSSCSLHVRLLVANCADERRQTDRQTKIHTD